VPVYHIACHVLPINLDNGGTHPIRTKSSPKHRNISTMRCSPPIDDEEYARDEDDGVEVEEEWSTCFQRLKGHF
jgi:hypothetical protein